MAETRARRRIRQAVESRGYKLTALEWEPWSDGGDKSGICGGWFGTVDRPYRRNEWPGDEIMGLSVEETLAWIDEFIDPPEPCACPELDLLDHPLRALNPTWMHSGHCRWHIRYWLRWWGDRQMELEEDEG